MRRILNVLIPVLLIGATASGCSDSNSSEVDLAGRTFTSQSLVIDGAETPAADGGTIAVTFTDDGVSINAGCNTLFGNATWSGGILEVEGEALASTMMACSEALMDQDQLLSTFFISDPRWSLEGSQLTLSTDSVTLEMTEQ